MQAYNLNAVTYTTSLGDVDVLKLGEKGRGRKLTLVNCPKGIIDGATVTLFDPKFGKTKTIIQGNKLNRPCWLMRISTEAGYARGASGNVCVRKGNENKVVVVARGQGAFRDGGPSNYWADLLVQVRHGTVLRVKPSMGEVYFIHVSDKITKISTSEGEKYGELGLPLNTFSYICL